MDFACSDSINQYIQFVGGDVPQELMDNVIISANIYIESCLQAANVPLPADVPDILVQAANYYSIHDLLSIVELNEDSTVDNSFLKKADVLIKNYIKSQKSCVGVVNDDYPAQDKV